MGWQPGTIEKSAGQLRIIEVDMFVQSYVEQKVAGWSHMQERRGRGEEERG